MADATLNDVYAPLEQNLKDQAIANANRYAQNQADVTSITGVLSQIAPQDKQRINQQFAASVQQQQEALAGRTAEARKGQLAGQQGAATAASEMGSGGMPVPTDSYSNQAINQGIAQSNQAQTNWAGLMGAMQQQQLGNADATQAGYGFQVANALQNLFRNRQTQIGGETQALNALQSQKAQSQLSAQAAGAEMAQESALAGAKNQTALQVAQTAAKAKIQGQQIAANARTGAAAISAAAKGDKTAKTPAIKTVSDWRNAVKSSGGSDQNISSMISMSQKAYDAVYAQLNPNAGIPGTKTVKPTSGQVYQKWVQMYGGKSGTMKFSGAVQDYIYNFIGN